MPVPSTSSASTAIYLISSLTFYPLCNWFVSCDPLYLYMPMCVYVYIQCFCNGNNDNSMKFLKYQKFKLFVKTPLEVILSVQLILISLWFIFAFSSPYRGMSYSPLVLPVCFFNYKRHVIGFKKLKVGLQHFLECIKPWHWVSVSIVKTTQPQILNKIKQIF